MFGCGVEESNVYLSLTEIAPRPSNPLHYMKYTTGNHTQNRSIVGHTITDAKLPKVK